ncbi:MAG: tetratricopeptide repeat protein, partial [Desulfamplus sp.]|nr:tetratricopeptide repeat protein [Desulfamplus sp.]
KQDYPKALSLYKEALALNPDILKIRHDMVKTLIFMGNYDEALSNADLLISKNDKNWVYYQLKGFILLWQNKYNDALINFQKALKLLGSENLIPPKALLLNTGVTLSLKGHYKIADEILGDMIKEDMLSTEVKPDNMPIYLALIENSLRSGDKIKAQAYASRMVIHFGKEVVLQNISLFMDNRASAPISKKIVEPFIQDFIENM